jgi:hypothetical protein
MPLRATICTSARNQEGGGEAGGARMLVRWSELQTSEEEQEERTSEKGEEERTSEKGEEERTSGQWG